MQVMLEEQKGGPESTRGSRTPYPRCGPPFMRSKTWAGFSSCLNLRRNFTPWLSPLLELTKTNKGLVQDGGHEAFQKPGEWGTRREEGEINVGGGVRQEPEKGTTPSPKNANPREPSTKVLPGPSLCARPPLCPQPTGQANTVQDQVEADTWPGASWSRVPGMKPLLMPTCACVSSPRPDEGTLRIQAEGITPTI